MIKKNSLMFVGPWQRFHSQDWESNISDVHPLTLDTARLLRSSSFRRLQYKTQVFANQLGDHYRTRLTHTLEVAHNAKIIAGKLHLNTGISELIALCHDLGHPPFGHAGEAALDQAAKRFGGFDHNVQTMRILHLLEEISPEFSGLNMSLPVLEGVCKHNGPWNYQGKRGAFMRDIFSAEALGLYPILEAQVAALADDITYATHDIDDGLRSGLIVLEDLLAINKIAEVYKTLPISDNVTTMLSYELRRLMIEDVVEHTNSLLGTHHIETPQDVYHHFGLLVCFSEEMLDLHTAIMDFLYQKLYRSFAVNRTVLKVQHIVNALYTVLLAHPNCLPPAWQYKTHHEEPDVVVLDYIAGMTDRFAVKEYQRLCDYTNLESSGLL